MNKVVKYICILIIIIGILFLFSGVTAIEGYETKESRYANLVNTGVAGTNKSVNIKTQPNGMGAYGSSGISKKGYDANGNAILDFDQTGTPIVGYQGNKPILGKVAAPPSNNIPQLGAVGQITGFNTDGTPIFDKGVTNVIPAVSQQSNPSNQALGQNEPVKRFNF